MRRPPCWLCLVAFAAACGPPPSVTATEEAAAPAPAPSPDAAVAPIVALDRKLDAYAQCLHRSRGPMARAWSRWAPHVDEDGRPRKRNEPPRLDPIDGELAACRHATGTLAEAEPPRPDLDPLVVAYEEAAETFADLTRRLAPYYAEERYTDDDWALSVKLAPDLRAAHEDVTAAGEHLAQALATAQDEADPKMAAHIEATHGRGPAWHAYEAYAAAKALARCVASEGQTPTAPACEAERSDAGTAAEALAGATDPSGRGAFWIDAFAASLARFRTAAAPVTSGKKVRPPDPIRVATAFDELDRDFRQIEVDFAR